MCCKETKWIEKTRETWDHAAGCHRLGRFLRLCINNISDQLRGNYQPDAKWMRKHKWWHAMYYRAKGTDLVNF